MTKEAEQRGNWAIVDEALIFLQDGKALKTKISESQRADGVTCVKISADADQVDGSVQLCPCEG